MIDLDQPAVKNLNNKECFYKCDDPKGSLIAGVLVLFLGLIMAPVFIRFVDELFPFTLDNFLQLMFDEFSRVLGYSLPISTIHYVIYASFSVLAGIVTVKTLKSVAVPFVFLAISLIAFFFLALFYLGITIDYDLFFSSLVASILTFLLAIFLPTLTGTLTVRILMNKKNCFVMGKGTTVKE